MKRERRTYKDYRDYDNLEPQDFTRIHDSDLQNLLRELRSCYREFSHPMFTDRYGDAKRIKKVLDVGAEWSPTIDHSGRKV